MDSYQEINRLIDTYADAVRAKDAQAVARLFADSFDHRVHGLSTRPDDPWNSKQEHTPEGIRTAYEAFFSGTRQLSIEYTDRIIDPANRSAALIVRVQGPGVAMANALHLRWNETNKIIYFHNWYGMM